MRLVDVKEMAAWNILSIFHCTVRTAYILIQEFVKGFTISSTNFTDDGPRQNGARKSTEPRSRCSNICNIAPRMYPRIVKIDRTRWNKGTLLLQYIYNWLPRIRAHQFGKRAHKKVTPK